MLKKCVIGMATVVFCFLMLTSCTGTKDFKPDAENLAQGATYTYADGKVTDTMNFSDGGNYRGVRIKFPSAVTINTIVLGEEGFIVTSFELWTEIGGKSTLLYKQDEIGSIRYCVFEEVTVREIRLVAASQDGRFRITRFEAYNVERDQGDFRITTYLPAEQFLNDAAYRDGIKHVTDIIIFGTATYDEEGNIFVDDKVIDKTISVIEEVRGNKTARIFVNFVCSHNLQNTDGLSNEKFFAYVQKLAMKDNKTKLIENMKNFIISKNLDGIAFDYEYPYNLHDYKIYGDFLIDLKASMPEKLISIAVAPWGLKFSKYAYDAIDMLEVMAYDLMDTRGNHSGWQLACVDAIDYMVAQGVDKDKIDLGIPFYSRPVDYGDYWGSWRGDVDKTDRFTNYVGDEFLTTDYYGNEFLVKGRWYNGETLVADKTAFSFDNGLGGMMIWHYNCDVEYENERSLLHAMNDVFKD